MKTGGCSWDVSVATLTTTAATVSPSTGDGYDNRTEQRDKTWTTWTGPDKQNSFDSTHTHTHTHTPECRFLSWHTEPPSVQMDSCCLCCRATSRSRTIFQALLGWLVSPRSPFGRLLKSPRVNELTQSFSRVEEVESAEGRLNCPQSRRADDSLTAVSHFHISSIGFVRMSKFKQTRVEFCVWIHDVVVYVCV